MQLAGPRSEHLTSGKMEWATKTSGSQLTLRAVFDEYVPRKALCYGKEMIRERLKLYD